MFNQRPGSGLYTLTSEFAQVAASGQVGASDQLAASCLCRLLSHQTLLWHHRLGHPSLPCLHGMHSCLLRTTPQSSSFPPTTAPLQTLHMDVWGPTRVHGQDQERYFLLVFYNYTRYTTVFPLWSKADARGVLIDWIIAVRRHLSAGFEQDLQQNGIAERRVGLAMEVARTSMIQAAAPHFLWSFAVRYAAHQLNLWPRVSVLETSPTLRWTGEVGDASAFWVWGALSLVRDTTAGKLSPRTLRCVFLGFPTDAPPWQFYHPASRRGLAPSGVSQVNPPPFVEPLEISSDTSGLAEGGDLAADDTAATRRSPQLETPPGFPPRPSSPPPQPDAVDSGAAMGGETGGADSRGAGPEVADSRGAEFGGAGSGGASSGGADTGDAASPSGGGVTAAAISSTGDPLAAVTSRLGATGTRGARAGGAGGTGSAGARVARAGGTRAAGSGGARAGGVGGTRAGGAGDAGAAGAGRARDGGAGGTGDAGAGGARAGVAGGTGATGIEAAGARGTRAAGVGGTGAAGAGGAGAGGTGVSGVGGTGGTGGAGAGGAGAAGGADGTERREPESCPASPVRPPPVPVTHAMALRPSSIPQHVALPSPPASSLPDVLDPESDLARAASPTVTCLLTTVVTDPSFESTVASALVTELVNFAATHHLDNVVSLVTESESVCPPSVGGELALGCDILEDRQFELECLMAILPRFTSMLLCPEGDPKVVDIPTPCSYAESITGQYSSQWQTAMDAEMASWKSTGTYVDEVPPPGANIVDGMWIFRVNWPPGSPPAFKAHYVARGFSQRQGVDFFRNFSPTLKMTTLWVLLHVAAQRDYELHSLEFSSAFLEGNIHEEIWLRHPPGFTGSFPEDTQSSLRRPVYGLRQVPREWHDTLKTTLAALSFRSFEI
ncbi:unnamed protein product [Closterium sp. NIES-53]